MQDKYELIRKGLSNIRFSTKTGDTGNSMDKIDVTGDNDVEIITLDEFMKGRNDVIGFIKVDIEGHGFKMIQGGIQTIKKFRPVLALSIYHNYEEFFLLKPYLEANLPNYVFEY